jgi:ribonuclease HI
MHKKSPDIVRIYTDGACSGNPGPGGWAALLTFKDTEKMIGGGEAATTNNRMELMAAIEALKALKKHCVVELYTDSTYLKDGVTKWVHSWKKNNWRTAAKKPVKNMELWHELDELASKHTITWHWVKAHNGHEQNERVDEHARNSIPKA